MLAAAATGSGSAGDRASWDRNRIAGGWSLPYLCWSGCDGRWDEQGGCITAVMGSIEAIIRPRWAQVHRPGQRTDQAARGGGGGDPEGGGGGPGGGGWMDGMARDVPWKNAD